MSDKKAVLVVGAGDATGGAIARRFAREGYIACVTRRSADRLAPLVAQIEAAGGKAVPFGSDARNEDEVIKLVERIEREIAPIEVAVFNIGGNVRFGITETTTRVYTKVWEMGALAGFLMGREVAKVMLPRERGSIFFTGATASLRGRDGFAAKPKGIHVAHLVIDGAIDTAFIRDTFPERYKLKEKEGIVDPDAIAEAYWQLHTQPKNAWTHEMDLRPWMEPF